MLKSMNFFRGKSMGRVGRSSGISPLAPVILGLVPRILWKQVSNLVNKLALLLHKCWLREDSRDKPENDWCWERGFSAFSQSGRSMIEMLGVLAIIGVLSVGGIAGYSKAMSMWRSNIQRQMLTEIITAAIKMKSNLNAKTTKWEDITPTLAAMGDIPEGITYEDGYLYDKSGIRLHMYYGFQPWTNSDGTPGGETRCSVWFYFTQNGAKFAPEVQEFCRNLALASQQAANDVILIATWLHTSSHSNGNQLYTGKTLQTATISEITAKCNQTFEESGTATFELILNPY